MNFDLSQLLQGPVRDLVLDQVTKKFCISSESGSNLLTKGVSMIVGSLLSKSTTKESANSLFDLIKKTSLSTTNTNINPLDILIGKGNEKDESSLMELGKSLLPTLFGTNSEAISNHLAATTNTSSSTVKGLLSMLLPVIFSFLKGKISSGLELSGFIGLLAGLAKLIIPYLDNNALQALGFKSSFNDLMSNVSKLAPPAVGATSTKTAITTYTNNSTTASTNKKSGISVGKFILPAAILLAALLGYKSCSSQPDSNKVTQAIPVAATKSKAVEGLGDLSWNKTDKDFTLAGTVASEQVKADLINAFKGLSSDLPMIDKLAIDPKVGKFKFGDFTGLANLFSKFPTINGAFNGKLLKLTGTVENETAKAGLIDSIKGLLGNSFNINADAVKVVTIPQESSPSVEILTVEGLGDLSWNKTDKDFTLAGTVSSEQVKTDLINTFKELSSGLPVVDKLTIDPKIGKFEFSNFAGLANLFNKFPTVNGAFTGKLLNLTGIIENEAAKIGLIDGIKGLLGDRFTINVDGLQVLTAQAETNAEAEAIKDMSATNLDLDIVFATGSTDIHPRYFHRLNALANFLVENKRHGEIAGYTDNVGNAQSNQHLSEVRANTIRDYLIAKGVPAESLVAVGYGQENPVADNNTAEGRNRNRRIEFRTVQ